MSAPIFVAISRPSGHSHEIGCASVEEAIERADKVQGLASVRILGDGFDYDCDGDGFYLCNDGLSESDRELVEAAGYA